ncbi:hypothetical protein BDR26DRAFT_867903 [Obelidium mucronatum]|nr:hypothetical protein BDR26DRAFT_867903 [Obelidium mucronatum]
MFQYDRTGSVTVRRHQYRIITTISGAWIGSFCLPLDWNVAWKLYPIPIVIGSFVGFLVGVFCSELLLLF